MKKFLKIFFITLGVIFFVLILAGIYLYTADPFQIKPLIKSFTEQGMPVKPGQVPINQQTNVNKAVVGGKLNLTASQEQVLKKIGVDPASLPSTITPAMEQCFYEKLGTKRTDEIMAGSQPTAADVFIARSCVK